MESASSTPILAEVIVRLEQDSSLSPKRRRDLKSAVARICKMTGVDPRTAPASMQLMRPRINTVRPAKDDLTPKPWANLRANFRAAVVQARPRAPRPTHPEWGPLRAALTTKWLRTALSRLMSFCEAHGIPPAGVC